MMSLWKNVNDVFGLGCKGCYQVVPEVTAIFVGEGFNPSLFAACGIFGLAWVFNGFEWDFDIWGNV